MAWASECFVFGVENERDCEDLLGQEMGRDYTFGDQKGWQPLDFPPSVLPDVPQAVPVSRAVFLQVIGKLQAPDWGGGADHSG